MTSSLSSNKQLATASPVLEIHERFNLQTFELIPLLFTKRLDQCRILHDNDFQHRQRKPCPLSIITALHGMHTRSSDENSVCPSVCQTNDLWQNERKLCPYSYTIWKTIYPSFVTRRMVGGGNHLKISVKLTASERNRWFSVDIRS